MDWLNSKQLDRIEQKLDMLTFRMVQGEKKIMADLTGLTAEVARNTTVEASALALIQGLAAQITAAGTDPVALKAITDQLTQNDNALATAVAANTPAA